MATVTRIVLRLGAYLVVLCLALALFVTVLGQTLPSQGAIVYMALGRSSVDLWILDPIRGISLAIADHVFTATPIYPSPDGQQIAFFRETAGDAELHVINADGSNLRRLENLTPDLAVSWLPDNQTIVAASVYGTTSRYNVRDMSVEPLPSNDVVGCGLPTLSPDGSRIAGTVATGGGSFFCSGRGISVMDTEDSGNQVDFLPDERDLKVAWSPNGEHLAFYGEQGVYVTSDHAADTQQIWNSRVVSAPMWSPDGSRLAWVGDTFDIYVSSTLPTAEAPVNLTAQVGIEAYFWWSPDGTQIAFTSTLFSNTEIYSVNVETGAIQQITANSTHELNLVWLP
jgi:Tol biopolymer transport system component